MDNTSVILDETLTENQVFHLSPNFVFNNVLPIIDAQLTPEFNQNAEMVFFINGPDCINYSKMRLNFKITPSAFAGRLNWIYMTSPIRNVSVLHDNNELIADTDKDLLFYSNYSSLAFMSQSEYMLSQVPLDSTAVIIRAESFEHMKPCKTTSSTTAYEYTNKMNTLTPRVPLFSVSEGYPGGINTANPVLIPPG